LYDQFDGEMEKRGLETVLVIGESTLGNPELAYVAGTTIPRGGIFVKRRGRDPILVVSNIDVGSARRGRVRKVQTYTDYHYERLIQRHGRERGYVKLLQSLLRSIGTEGRVCIYGHNDFSRLLSVADSLRRLGYRISGESDTTVIESLRETKDAAEVERIRDVGVRAAKVVRCTLQMLRECKVSAGKLKTKKETLTVGMVKSRINGLLAEHNLMAPEGTVFAIGKSSADPHEFGILSEPVRSGEPIVFDLFPMAADGYWFDLTRTYVIGKPSRRIRRMFEAVLDVQLKSLDSIQHGVPASQIMNHACDTFERYGFKTIRATLKGDRAASRVGFIHSLGHGVGLTVGEKPYLSLLGKDTLRTGQVFTVEPGLYEPKVGGVRVEDTILLRRRRIYNLTPLEKDLTI